MLLVILSNNILSGKVRRVKPITNPTNSPTNIKIKNKREKTYGCRRKDGRKKRCVASSWWKKDGGGPRWMLAERERVEIESERESKERVYSTLRVGRRRARCSHIRLLLD